MPQETERLVERACNPTERAISALLKGAVLRYRMEDVAAIASPTSLDIDASRAPLQADAGRNLNASFYPLREVASFRPSEILQGLYLGAMKDVAEPHREMLNIKRGIRVFVCCCAIPKMRSPENGTGPALGDGHPRGCARSFSPPSSQNGLPFEANGVFSPKSVELDTPPLLEVHIFQERLEDSADGPGRRRHTMEVIKYRGDWWRDSDGEFLKILEWVDTHFLSHLRRERSDARRDAVLRGRELIIRIAALDDVDFDLARPDAPYLSVVPRLIGYIMDESRRDRGDPPSAVLSRPNSQRFFEGHSHFGIAIYCAAGRSRSVTMLAATLIHQFANCLVAAKIAPSLSSGHPASVLFESPAGDSESIAAILVAVVLNFIRSRRVVSSPNPGFRQQLLAYTTKLLATVV